MERDRGRWKVLVSIIAYEGGDKGEGRDNNVISRYSLVVTYRTSN